MNIVNGTISINDFGAIGDGVTDNWQAIINACNYAIANPTECYKVRVPVGDYHYSKPLLLQNNGAFCTIKLKGDFNNKSSSNQYLSKLTYTGKSGYAIGIQLGRSIDIRNLTILGQYTFPNSVNNYNIGTLKFSDWVDPTITDTRNAPYAGIVIDPNANISGANGGTSDVTIKNCAIKQWMVGICLSPNVTLNDEMINILEDDIECCRVAIAIGQDQSKTINIRGLKVWASCHTVVDGVNYGRGTGGGSVFCENWNIAGNCNQLFNIITDRFPLSASRIYSESIFRIGTVMGQAGANFRDCSIDFLTGPGMPAADYLLYGNANFSGGVLRYYDGSQTRRLNLVNVDGTFRDMTLNNQPITAALYGWPSSVYPGPVFDNVNNYYHNGKISNNPETLLNYNVHDISELIVDRTTWTATMTGWKFHVNVNVGDYILASPASYNRQFYDNGVAICNTKQIGRVISISGDTAKLDDVGLNVIQGEGYDNIFISKVK
jgi:hypothetical protein